MKEKDRILELVQQGIISSEEAITLLEKLGKKTSTEMKEDGVKEQTAKTMEEKDSETFDGILEGLANTATTVSSLFEEKDEVLTQLQSSIKEKENRMEELYTHKELEPLTTDQEMELKRLQEEVDVLTSQKQALELEKKEQRKEKAKQTKEEMDEAIAKMKKKVEETDWKQSTSDSVSQFGSMIGRLSKQLADAVTESVKNVSETFQFDGTSTIIFGKGKYKARHPYHVEQELGDATVVDIKVANGDVRLKTADQEAMTIDGELRAAGSFESEEELRAYLEERVSVRLENDTLIVSSPSKQVFADVTIILPKKEYDYVSVKALSADVRLKELQGKDFYLNSKNGDISFKDTVGTMMEVESLNGDVKQFGGQFKDVVIRATNGDVRVDGAVTSGTVETTNGDVYCKVVHQDATQMTAKTVNGDVRLEVADSLELEADFQTALGDLEYHADDFEVIRHEKATTKKRVLLRRQEKEVPVQLHASTTTGDVELIQVKYINDKN